MRTERHLVGIRARGAGLALLAFGLVGCGGSGPAQTEKPVAAGPPTIDVVRVVEQPVNVTLSLPGQLDPYETVAVYPKVTGFVKTIRVDRGSRVRTGELMAELEAPELLAQRAEAQSKLQAAEAQLAVARSKADADASTADKLKAASATPGVVAGNDLVLAQKAVSKAEGRVEQTDDALAVILREALPTRLADRSCYSGARLARGPCP